VAIHTAPDGVSDPGAGGAGGVRLRRLPFLGAMAAVVWRRGGGVAMGRNRYIGTGKRFIRPRMTHRDHEGLSATSDGVLGTAPL